MSLHNAKKDIFDSLSNSVWTAESELAFLKAFHNGGLPKVALSSIDKLKKEIMKIEKELILLDLFAHKQKKEIENAKTVCILAQKR